MKILIAEDNKTSRKILESTLKKWGYDIISVPDGNAAWQILKTDDAPQLAILDWVMPGIDGLELCKRIRLKNKKLYSYIIMLTAKVDKEDIIKGLDAGADDYINKPFYPFELKARIKAGIRIIDLQTKLNVLNEKLLFQATHDSLTKLLNRKAIVDLIQREISRSYRNKSHLGLLMIDIDHFKIINDNYGHLAGDEILSKLSTRIETIIRDYDTLGRYGGEEFLVVLPNCNKKEILTIAERIRQAIKKTSMITEKQMVNITVSIGAILLDIKEKMDMKDLIRAADNALYEAKNSGRDMVVLSN